MKIEKQVKKPDFVGVGAQRAGTSWLYHALDAHPEIFLPLKEVHFFDEKYDEGIDWYFSLFDASGSHTIAGEFTPDYLSEEQAMIRLAEDCPDVKVLVVLREPFERAYSAYNLYKAHGRFEGISFAEAVLIDKNIIQKSLYSHQIERLFKLFPKENIKIYDFDDISNSPEKVVQDIYSFLGVNSSFIPHRLSEKYNVGGNAKIQRLLNLPKIQKKLQNSSFGKHILKLKRFKIVVQIKHWLLNQQGTENNKEKYYSPELRSQFKNDLINLEKILNKSFSKWY